MTELPGMERRKRILILGVNILSGRRTGGMLYTAKVYEYLAKQSDFQVEYVELSQLGAWSRSRLMSLYLMLRHGKRYDCLVIDASIYYFLYLLYGKMRGAKIVCVYHHFISKERRSVRKAVSAIRERMLVNIVDKSIFVSNSTLNDAFELGFHGNDFILVKPGLDKETWPDRTKEYAVSGGKFDVLYVGHVAERKGVLDLVLGFGRFLHGVTDMEGKGHIRLNIVGNDRADPVFTSELRQSIQSHGLSEHVDITGWLNHDEAVEYYRRADVFVHPSHYEGYGIVAMEAASFGLPLIVSDAGALPEVVQEGKYGFIFRVGDRDSLGEKLMVLYRDHALRLSMSENSAMLYGDSFTWDEVGRRVVEYLG